MTIDIAGNRSLRDLLCDQAERQPDKTFLLTEDMSGSVTPVTYGETVALALRAAEGFARVGIGKGDRVIVHMSNSLDWVVSWFGLSWIGAVIVPTNTASTSAELSYMAQHCEAVGVVTETRFLDAVRAALPELGNLRHVVLARTGQVEPGTVLLGDLMEEGAAQPPAVEVGSDDVMQMLFTSGTTARPKAVVLTHANALIAGQREAVAVGIDETDRSLTSLPIFHVNGQCVTLLAALSVGATAILLEQFSASTFWSQVRSHEATAISLVAMQVRTLLAQPPSDDDARHKVRRTFFAINVSDDEKKQFEERFGVEFINGYGLSEAMVLVSAAPVHGAKRWPSIGLPTPGRRIRIVDEDGTELPAHAVGEITVQGVPGRTLMKEYYRDPEATARTIRDGWLHTGDNGYLDEKGYLYFFDRKKDVIKRAGENISATEVEFALMRHPDVVEAAVIAIPDAVRDEAVKAFVVLAEGRMLTQADLVEHCATSLARYKVPSVIEFRDSLPKTSVGKIEKKLLRAEQAQSGEGA
jgi:crotonobetaine/carnitine-CoA ligase